MLRRLITATILIALTSIATWAQTAPADTTAHAPALDTAAPVKTSFAWGAELGSGIDISGHDMSNINFTAYFGLKNQAFNLLGVGAGVEMMMGNGCRVFPIFGIIQTGFGVKNARCFADFRMGVAINRFDDNYRATRTFVAPGVGINLASGSRFRSYLIISYVYNDVHYPGDNPEYGVINGLNYANVAIGISF